MFDINPFSITKRDLTGKSWLKIFLSITIFQITNSVNPYLAYKLTVGNDVCFDIVDVSDHPSVYWF